MGDLAVGAWNGHDYEIAHFTGRHWSFQVPEEGDSVWAATGSACTYHEGSWHKTFDLYSSPEDELDTATDPTPNAIPKARPDGKLAPGWISAQGTGVVLDTLTYTDTANKVLGPLSNTPIEAANVAATVLGGPDQQYTQDYTVREVTGGSAPGYYICVDPGSTAPGGGSFQPGGSNPGTGISSMLEAGDKLKATYSSV